jgi:hypothetical protein
MIPLPSGRGAGRGVGGGDGRESETLLPGFIGALDMTQKRHAIFMRDMCRLQVLQIFTAQT